MKTLKQQLQEKEIICFAANGDEILMLDPRDVPKIIKKWLTQKRPKPQTPNEPWTPWECDYDTFIEELLEELNQ